jgi:hypothetical protein
VEARETAQSLRLPVPPPKQATKIFVMRPSMKKGLEKRPEFVMLEASLNSFAATDVEAFIVYAAPCA